jgi:hypothetical protein
MLNNDVSVSMSVIDERAAMSKGPVVYKNLQDFLSHRIFKCMHEVLIIDENKN